MNYCIWFIDQPTVWPKSYCFLLFPQNCVAACDCYDLLNGSSRALFGVDCRCNVTGQRPNDRDSMVLSITTRHFGDPWDFESASPMTLVGGLRACCEAFWESCKLEFATSVSMPTEVWAALWPGVGAGWRMIFGDKTNSLFVAFFLLACFSRWSSSLRVKRHGKHPGWMFISAIWPPFRQKKQVTLHALRLQRPEDNQVLIQVSHLCETFHAAWHCRRILEFLR